MQGDGYHALKQSEEQPKNNGEKTEFENDEDKDEFEHGWDNHYCYYCNEVDDLSFDGFG